MNHLSTRRRGRPVSERTMFALPHATGKSGAAAASQDAVALEIEFDFEEEAEVLYLGSGPGPRTFLLRFWRHGKDGIMHLLGYRKQGAWRDPTVCYPHSFVRYYKPNHAPEDDDRPNPVARLAYRESLIELEPGMYEVPAHLAKVPVPAAAPVRVARTFPTSTRAKPLTRRPQVGVPVHKQIGFKDLSVHFQQLGQADRELAGVVAVMKHFPELHLTLRGNAEASPTTPPHLMGRGPIARASHDFPFPIVTGDERYSSFGHLMDARARAIKEYLVRKGVPAHRITCERGERLREKRSVTIIFSKAK